MEWSKERTLKLIELLQLNASLWNPSLCDTRRDKQKRREELRVIAEILGISASDTTKKIQHLRTQYNRESAREARANTEDPEDRYISNWYAFDFLHFMKDSNKPFRILNTSEDSETNSHNTENIAAGVECKLTDLSPPNKITKTDPPTYKSELTTSPKNIRDEFSVFGEYIANELRSIKGDKNLLIAKKKIQDVIFEMKMSMIADQNVQTNEPTTCAVFHTSHNGKLYNTLNSSHLEPLPASQTPPSSQISEIIINSACHYPNFKVDNH